MHLLSKIFRPVDSMRHKTKGAFQSKNQSLLTDYGLMKPLDKGTYFYLPILQRSIDKANAIIERFMTKIDAHKISIPNLTPLSFWRDSGRFDDHESELLLLHEKNDWPQLLGPTFEEAVTHLMGFGHVVSEKQLPFRLYQIGNKFRKESPRFGLLRSREFIMKDLYTFDADKESATKTYEAVNDVYNKFFKFIGVPFVKMEADATQMGGYLSHEYHYLSPIGEAKLQHCLNCGHLLADDRETRDTSALECSKCKAKNVQPTNGIEVGHAFLLGDTYSKRQKAHWLKDGQPVPLQMGCYGIGITRLIGAAVEKLSTDTYIRWPFPLAPFSVCIIPPEVRSKAFKLASHHLETVYNGLNRVSGLNDSILIDDRTRISIGERYRDARRLGIPLVVVIGRGACDPENPQFELHFMHNEKQCDLTLNDLIAEVTNFSNDQLKED